MPRKPYRTPPTGNIQSSATQKCCGRFSFSFSVYFFLQYFFFIWHICFHSFFNLDKYFFLYIFFRNLHLLKCETPKFEFFAEVVAKCTFAVWFHAQKLTLLFSYRWSLPILPPPPARAVISSLNTHIEVNPPPPPPL